MERLLAALLLVMCVWAAVAPAAWGNAGTNITSLEVLESTVTADRRAVVSFRLEGRVCAVSAQGRMVALQDASATVLLELPDSGARPKVGEGLLVEGRNCTVTRGPYGIKFGTAPVVEIDGQHNPVQKSGKTFLESGLQPLRVEWHIGDGTAVLELEYEGPGMSRKRIPETALWRRRAAGTNSGDVEPGLGFANYEISDWRVLPDFQELKVAGTGLAASFDVSRRARPRGAAMVFTGFLQITNSGIYTFYVRSGDGARVYVGDPAAQSVVSLATNLSGTVVVRNLSEVMNERSDQQWTYLDGRVEFVRERMGLAELEIRFGQQSVLVTVLNLTSPFASSLRGATVRVTGICQRPSGSNENWAARLVVPGPEQVVIREASQPLDQDRVLTSVSQIRALPAEEARQRIPIKIRGIVTTANYWSCILQDAGGGVYLDYLADDWLHQPQPGEVWEFEGVTDAGAFSPIVLPSRGVCLGNAALPQGIRPTWSDLMDGSLDAEQVEIEAAVIAQSDSEWSLLTSDGSVSLLGDDYHPFPGGASAGTKTLLVGSIVRLRGVYAAEWNRTTHLVRPGVFWLGNAMISIIESAPTNVFAGPTKRVSDLLKFKSQAAALRRVRVAGVVLDSQPGEYILSDNSGSLRALTKDPQTIQEGDWVEAVGFPQLGGSSPRLLEAQVRKIGSAPRPQPVPLAIQELSDANHDAMLVRFEAELLSDKAEYNKRVLELQAGPNHFLARLRPRAGAIPLIRPGSRLQLTGVLSSVRKQPQAGNLDAFELLVNRPTDVLVLRSGPWWTLWRAITLIAILVGGLIVTLAWVALLRQTVARRSAQLQKEIETRQQVEQHRALEQERSRVAQDLHDELGAGLAELGILGALANNPAINQEKQQGYMNRLAELSRLLVTGLDEIVWAVNPKHDSSGSVSGYLCDYAQEFLNPTGIACRLETADTLPDHTLNPQQRHQLFLAFKEALTNVVKHAHATEVWVRIGGDEQALWVAVEDNGKGLGPMVARRSEDGLGNMVERMKQIGGECEIKNRSAGGTRVEFRLYTNQEKINV